LHATGLICQHRDVGDRRRAVGDRDRHVHQHPTGIVAGPGFAQPGQSFGELGGQGGPPDVGEQPRPACDTTPSPSAVTVIFGRVDVACTLKVLLYLAIWALSKHSFPW
jgi:hypothetical protein